MTEAAQNLQNGEPKVFELMVAGLYSLPFLEDKTLISYFLSGICFNSTAEDESTRDTIATEHMATGARALRSKSFHHMSNF